MMSLEGTQAPPGEKLTVPSGQTHAPPASDTRPDPASHAVRVTAKRNGEFGTCVAPFLRLRSSLAHAAKNLIESRGDLEGGGIQPCCLASPMMIFNNIIIVEATNDDDI
jgi:hypothetical protein